MEHVHIVGDKSDAAERFGRKRRELIESSLFKVSVSSRFPEDYSRLVDGYFKERLGEIRPVSQDSGPFFSVLAVGGYGRRELCLHSDIDVLVLFPGALPSWAGELCRDLLYPLWDAGLDLGYAVREVDECLFLAEKDFQVLTSLISARPVVGDPKPVDQLQSRFQGLLQRQCPVIRELLSPQPSATGQPLETIWPGVEPDLKNGPGGLREYHAMLWTAACDPGRGPTPMLSRPWGPFSRTDMDRLAKDVDFLLRTRSALHGVSGLKNDVLRLDCQPRVAEMLGFATQDSGLAVEQFLSCLHGSMGRIKAMRAASWMTMADGRTGPEEIVALGEGLEIRADGIHLLETQNGQLGGRASLDLFKGVAVNGKPLSWTSRGIVESSLDRLAEDLQGQADVLPFLVNIFLSPFAREAGREMLETGFLGALIPEFRQVQDYVQFDAYHLHLLGFHAMETLGQLGDFAGLSGTLENEVWEKTDDLYPLMLAGLFHDIGKGKANHAARGAKLTAQILRRFQVPESVLNEVIFLVQHHLYLFITATRSDLNDEAVLTSCARSIGGIGTLNRLYLLSVADARATGPRAWNEWTASLLREVYFKTRKLFTFGPLAEPSAVKRILGIRDTVRLLAQERFAPDWLEKSLDAMPSRYILTMPPETIVKHLEFIRRWRAEYDEERTRIPRDRAGRGLVVLEADRVPDQECFAVTVVSRDQRGLFPAMCGVLSLHDLDIRTADIHTWTDGTVVDIFKVKNPRDMMYIKDLWERIKRAVKYSLTGKLSLDYRLHEKRVSLLTKPQRKTGLVPRVRIDNGASDFFTLVEVVADDRLGRLYEIVGTFDRLSMEVHRAIIATHGDRIADVFSIRDHLGQKIEDQDQLQELEKDLLHALRRM